MILNLVIIRDSVVIEAVELCWEMKTVDAIKPKRGHDANLGAGKLWLIPDDKREAFLGHAEKILEKSSSNAETLYGYFAIKGAKVRWLLDDVVTWGLTTTPKISIGDPIAKRGDDE